MKQLLIFICVFSCIRCNKEYETFAMGYWKNVSSHYIKMQGYKNGILSSSETVELGPGEVVKAGSSAQRGRNYPGFWREYFTYSDSIVVIFDNQYKVIHYIFTPVSESPKSYLFSSARNIANINSYKCESTSEKRVYTNVYTYEFTEEDYKFAL